MKILNLLLLALLGLSSCGTLDGTVDRAADQTERIIDHTTEQLRELKTETLTEVEQTIRETLPYAIETILNAEGIAFLVVSLTCLLAFVVVIAGISLVTAVRTWARR